MKGDWSQTTRVIVVALILVLGSIFLYAIRQLLMPLTIAALIAYLLHPLVARIERHPRFSHNTAVLIVYLPFLAIIIATPSTFIPILVRQIQTLTDELILVVTQLQELLSRPIIILGQTITQEQLGNYLNLNAESLAPEAVNAIAVLEATSTSIIWFLLMLVTVFYLLRDWQGLRDWLIGLAPQSEQADLHHLLQDIDSTWRAYFRGTLTLMIMMAIFFTIAGLGLGLPGAVAIGLLTGLLSIIPELGPIIAGILATLVALFQGSNFLPLSNFWFAVVIAGIYVVVMQVKSFWIRPLVMGRFMHMNTGLVFVAIIGAALLSGIFAALIILPAIASISHIGHYVRCRLLNTDPWPETAVSTQPELEQAAASLPSSHASV